MDKAIKRSFDPPRALSGKTHYPNGRMDGGRTDSGCDLSKLQIENHYYIDHSL